MTDSKMSIDEIFSLVSTGLAQSLGVEPTTITLEQKLIDDLSIDPLDVVDLISFLENHLGREITGDLLDGAITVYDAVYKISEYL